MSGSSEVERPLAPHSVDDLARRTARVPIASPSANLRGCPCRRGGSGARSFVPDALVDLGSPLAAPHQVEDSPGDRQQYSQLVPAARLALRLGVVSLLCDHVGVRSLARHPILLKIAITGESM